ncbi:MAG: hypothetical protein ACQERX_02575 [Bacillota bacterium]
MSEKNEILNPKNPIWLEILRIYTIVVTGIGLFASFVAFFANSIDLGFFSALFVSLIITVSALIFYIINMVILNALYNLQKTRKNTDKIVELLEEKKEMTHE